MHAIPTSASDWLDVAPWRSRRLLLVSVDSDGSATEAATLTDKRQMLEHASGLLVAVWPGEYASSARLLTTSDRVAVGAAIA